MHPKVAGAIQEIDAALFNGDTFDDPDDRAELTRYVRRWAKELDGVDARPSLFHPANVRADGSWKDANGVVHAVNATWIDPNIDLGRETACGSTAWDPDHSDDYPVAVDATVDCMTCVVRSARS